MFRRCAWQAWRWAGLCATTRARFCSGCADFAAAIGSVQTSFVSESGTLRFSLPTGQPMVIDRLMTFVNDVEFADGISLDSEP